MHLHPRFVRPCLILHCCCLAVVVSSSLCRHRKHGDSLVTVAFKSPDEEDMSVLFAFRKRCPAEQLAGEHAVAVLV